MATFYLRHLTTINLYQPSRIDKEIEFPTEWNELDPVELNAVAEVMLSELQEKNIVKSVLLLELLKHRASLNKISFEVIQRLDPEDLATDGMPLIEFIYTSNGLTRQPFPTIRIKKNRFQLQATMHGLENDFDNMTAGEFEYTEIAFLQFQQTPDMKFLATIAAILYRPVKKEFIQYIAAKDKYITYDYRKAEQYFTRQTPEILFTIFMWYLGCRSMLPLYFPTLHEGGNEANKNDLLIFTKCIHSAAGPKNGTREQVRRTLLKALFFDMEQEAIKAKELKESYERH